MQIGLQKSIIYLAALMFKMIAQPEATAALFKSRSEAFGLLTGVTADPLRFYVPNGQIEKQSPILPITKPSLRRLQAAKQNKALQESKLKKMLQKDRKQAVPMTEKLLNAQKSRTSNVGFVSIQGGLMRNEQGD